MAAVRHPARLMIWDQEAGEYVESEGGICLARWASSTFSHDDHEICGEPATHWLDGVEVCSHHQRRVVRVIAAARMTPAQTQDEINAAVAMDIRRRTEAERLALEKRSIVYYLYRPSDRMIKIGTTERWKSRFSEHRRLHGDLLVLLAHAGGREAEREVHRKFASLRPGESEWFLPGIPLLRWIRKQRNAARNRPNLLPEQIPLDSLRSLLKSLEAGAPVRPTLLPSPPASWVAVVLAEPIMRPHPILMREETKWCAPEGAAAYLGLSLSELAAWHAVGDAPASIQVDKLIRYECSDLPEWARGHCYGAARQAVV